VAGGVWRSACGAALKGQSLANLAIAGALVAAGYVALTFYDVFALRVIGWRRVPYSVAALASFTSSTIGHSLGAAVLTGGLIRLRIYSGWGLTVIDVAKIAFVTGMTFLLGNALLLGGAIAYAPQAASAVDHLPIWANRAIGMASLFAIAAYFIWLGSRPRAIGRSGWRIVLPNRGFTLVQIAIGSADLILVTLAMYALLPASPAVGLVPVLIIFLSATLLGVASHAPGGLGVIELPLCLAALSLGLRELRVIAKDAAARHDRRD